MKMPEFVPEAVSLGEISTSNQKLLEFVIDIRVNHEFDIELLEGKKIRPIFVDGQLNDQALADYQDFIVEMLLELDEAGLVIIDSNESKKSKTSRYYTLADEVQYANRNAKFIIFLRVSDHVAELTTEQQKLIKQRRDNLSNRLHAKYKVRNILVNNMEYKTYDEAIEYVRKKALEYKRSLNNHQEENE